MRRSSAYSDILLDVPAVPGPVLADPRTTSSADRSRRSDLHAFIDALEPVLSDALAADPNNQIGNGSVAEFFAERKAWFSQRLLAVAAQIGAGPCVTTGVVPTAAPGLALSLRANPARDRLAVAFSLPDATPARLELFDVTGRRVEEREVGALGAGRHVVTLAGGRRLASGVYLVRLSHRARSVTVRAAVLR